MFKVGDKVRRKAEYRNINEWRTVAPSDDAIVVVKEVYKNGSSIRVYGAVGGWDADKFELVEEETVVDKQVPGVPDGYRLVRIGAPKQDEVYVNSSSLAICANANFGDGGYAIVEPITPPKPKTVTVVINKYLVGDLTNPDSLWIRYCTEKSAEGFNLPYRLLGVSETLEVEVDV